MEIVKNPRVNVVMFLACIALLLMASCAFGQIERMNYVENGKNITKKYNNSSIIVKTNNVGGDITINAYSDSIDSETITFVVYVYFPKTINAFGQGMLITYTDGTQDILHQSTFDKKDSYAEYSPLGNINNISTKKVKSILLRNIIKYDMVDKSYFKDFFSYL